MIYTYNDKKLEFQKIPIRVLILPLIICFCIIGLSFKVATNLAEKDGFLKGTEVPFEESFYAMESSEDSFSQASLVKELKRLNIRFPEIVLAQSILETGHYSSRIFEENNNLFGMKQARARSTSAVGTQLGHAYYDNWKQSVLDYALFQNAYMNKLRKPNQYLKYLDKNYAEANDYDKALTNIIEKEKLNELFLD